MAIDDRELRILSRLEKCTHFNGIQNESCKAGVRYDSFSDRKPCLGNSFPNDKRPIPECSLLRKTTREESEQREAEIDAAIERMTVAVPAAKLDAKEKGLGRGNGGRGSIPCPICKSGTLHYSVAGYNGHMHAKCTTDNCMSWME